MIPETLFDNAHYANVRRTLLEASTLPPWCYTSNRFHERELQRIFLKCWQFVGREDEIPTTGDYLTFTGSGGPVIIIRGEDGSLRAFYNACRHRGTQLLSGQGQVQKIICPYHSWVYSIDGTLQRAPGMENVLDFATDTHGLGRLRLDTWAGFVFISYASQGMSLSEYLGNMPEFFSAYRPADLVCVKRTEYVVQCNWKLLIENALEAYHTGTVHASTLGRQQTRPVDCKGHWVALFGYVENTDTMAVLPGHSTSLPHIPGLTGDQTRGTYFTNIFPCTQFVFAQDCMWWLAIQPEGVSRCRMVLGSCFPKSTTQLESFESELLQYCERWDRATPEDNAIAEAQQMGQNVAIRAPGRFSKSEFAVHSFSNWVLDQVLD